MAKVDVFRLSIAESWTKDYVQLSLVQDHNTTPESTSKVMSNTEKVLAKSRDKKLWGGEEGCI